MSLTLADARAIVAGTLAHGRDRSMQPLCVAVLDAGGHLIAFEREDGVANRRFDVAFGKAHGAISMGLSSRVLGELASDRPHFIDAVATAIGSLIPVPGGVIVVDSSGAAIGAVGVSGDSSDNDEAAALAGIDAAGLASRV